MLNKVRAIGPGQRIGEIDLPEVGIIKVIGNSGGQITATGIAYPAKVPTVYDAHPNRDRGQRTSCYRRGAAVELDVGSGVLDECFFLAASQQEKAHRYARQHAHEFSEPWR